MTDYGGAWLKETTRMLDPGNSARLLSALLSRPIPPPVEDRQVVGGD